MRFDLLLTISLLQVLRSSGEQAFLSKPDEINFIQDIEAEDFIILKDENMVTVENGSDGKWDDVYPDEHNSVAIGIGSSTIYNKNLDLIFKNSQSDEYTEGSRNKVCPDNSLIVEIRVKTCQSATGSEICAAEMKCSNDNGYFKTPDNRYGIWGSWYILPENKFICGRSRRIRVNQYKLEAVTGLKLQICQVKWIQDLSSSGEYKMIGEGHWGDWLGKVEAPKGTLACGVQVHFNYQKKADELQKDDTSIEELNFIYCKLGDWSNDQTTMQQPYRGRGSYMTNVKCGADRYISEVAVNIQPRQGPGLTKTENGKQVSADDRALSGVSILCKSLNYDAISEQSNALFYEFDNYKYVIPPTTENKYVCGSDVRYEKVDPNIKDLTGVNGLKVKYCKVNTISINQIS